MFLQTDHFIDDLLVFIVVRRDTELRLRKTCFRGKDEKLAGNFSAYGDCMELFIDPKIVAGLMSDATIGLALGDTTRSVFIPAGKQVGWEGTDCLANYVDEDLEPFSPNHKSRAFRVKTDLTTLTAPRTDLVTIVYEVKNEGHQIAIVVHSIYPGLDIGELDGDVTERESRVFFDLNHPGE